MNRSKVLFAIQEQEKNFKHFFHAIDKLKPHLPINKTDLNNDTIVEHIDQLIFRFTKAQDGIGKRLIPINH